jgi:hypothetical protein
MTDKSHPSGEKVWLAPALPRSVRPLLAGLGIELLAPGDRERATIRVESRAAEKSPCFWCFSVVNCRMRQIYAARRSKSPDFWTMKSLGF